MVSSAAIRDMKHMALDPRKRAILIKDMTCVGGLVLVLSNQDETVVKLALETILLLADSTEHRLVLRDFIGMTQQLQSIIDRQREDEVEMLASEVYDTLTKPVPLRDTHNTTGNSSRYGGSKKQSVEEIGKHAQRSRRSSIQKGLHGHRIAKTIILQLRGLMNKCDRDVCMRLLIQVKGVISITFDQTKKRCILRTKPEVKPEALVKAVARTQSIHAEQVIKNEQGEEHFLSFGQSHLAVDKENDTTLPDYLPDDEDMVEDDNPKAVGRVKDSRKGNTWLNAAASFISNSFYW